MDLNNQNATTTNTNTDSAAPDFDSSSDIEQPSIDMDAINDAIKDVGGKDPNIQNTFDVNSISLDDVPSSQADLDKRLEENPDMSLAGETSDSADTKESSTDMPMVDPLDASTAPVAKPAPAAAFVDGDIIDEEAVSDSAKSEAPSYENINTDPLANFSDSASTETVPAAEVADSSAPVETATTEDAPATDSAPADPASTDSAPAAEGAPAQAPTADETTHISNTITVPAAKSKKPIFIGIGVGVLVVVIVVLIAITASK